MLHLNPKSHHGPSRGQVESRHQTHERGRSLTISVLRDGGAGGRDLHISDELLNEAFKAIEGSGRGPRTCLGKSISLMGTNKPIPEVVLRVDVEMVEKDAEGIRYNDWFVKQQGFLVKISKRPCCSEEDIVMSGMGEKRKGKGLRR